MKNFDKYLLFSYISYISIFILIFIFGITGVFAASYTGFDYSAQLYDNVNGNLTSVTTGGPAAVTGLYEGYIAYTANSSGGAWGISSPTTLLSNHTYTLTASIPNECGKLVLSTYNRIGVGTSMNNAKTSYQNNTNVNEVYSKVIGGNNFLIQFAFTPTINGSFIVFPFSTDTSCGSSRTILESISIEDLGINGATQENIDKSLNQQTIEINTTINNLGSDIKDSIKDTFEECRPSVNLYNPDEAYIIGAANQDIALNYIYDLKVGDTYTFSTPHPWTTINVYDSNNNQIRSYGGIENSYKQTVTIQNGDSYLILIFNAGVNTNINNYDFTGVQFQTGSIATEYEPFGKEYCTNKIDETNDKLDETNNQLGDLNNSLNNSDSSGATNDASNFFSNFTTDTFGLTSIITAPLSLINNLTSSSCSTLRLPLPYLDNKYLDLPCMETIYSKYFGSFFTIYQTITFGIVAYWVIVRIFNQVKDFKNPDHDEIEVFDL